MIDSPAVYATEPKRALDKHKSVGWVGQLGAPRGPRPGTAIPTGSGARSRGLAGNGLLPIDAPSVK